jgi:hypothetical protein
MFFDIIGSSSKNLEKNEKTQLISVAATVMDVKSQYLSYLSSSSTDISTSAFHNLTAKIRITLSSVNFPYDSSSKDIYLRLSGRLNASVLNSSFTVLFRSALLANSVYSNSSLKIEVVGFSTSEYIEIQAVSNSGGDTNVLAIGIAVVAAVGFVILSFIMYYYHERKKGVYPYSSD